MTRREIKVLACAMILLIPVIGIASNDLFIMTITAVYLIFLFSENKSFWTEVYKAALKLENIILK